MKLLGMHLEMTISSSRIVITASQKLNGARKSSRKTSNISSCKLLPIRHNSISKTGGQLVRKTKQKIKKKKKQFKPNHFEMNSDE